MNDLQVFKNPQFGTLRTIEEDGKVLFVATDVANMLGYKNPWDAVKKHCRYLAKREVPHPQNPNKKIEVNVIPEGDLYRLIAHSELPAAETFESWVFDEVLLSLGIDDEDLISALESLEDGADEVMQALFYLTH